MYKISVSALKERMVVYADDESKYDIWGTSVTLVDVDDCLKNNILEELSYSAVADSRFLDIPYNHAARIAYLVKNKDMTPIDLDVSIPCLNYYADKIVDGNHRVAAAIYRGDEYIIGEFGGDVQYFKKVFKARKI